MPSPLTDYIHHYFRDSGNKLQSAELAVISGTYEAGKGISTNEIANVGTSLWIVDKYGIHNKPGNVGIRGNSVENVALNIIQENTGGSSAAIQMTSGDTWHTVYSMTNTTVPKSGRFSFEVGGRLNNEIGTGNFGIMNHKAAKWSLKINGNNNNVGIGMDNLAGSEQPRSKLHVFAGDVNIDNIGNGIIMKSPNGGCWRITVNNKGTLVSNAINCP